MAAIGVITSVLGGIGNAMTSVIGGAFRVLGSTLSGILSQAFTLFTNQLKGGSKLLISFHKEGISYARSVGLGLKEAQAYTNTLISRTEVLAQKYGVTAEQIAAVQKNLSDATGRAMMLNNVEAERMVQINKLVGENTNKAFMTEIMQHMGGQLSTAQGAVSKAYATAAKRGLDAANFSAKVAQNLTMANKLSFRNGVDGITKMTALSEKLGFNLQAVDSAAKNFLDIDKAIEHSAQLQMLGGAAGVYGSNPLTMAYEANYDPEAFTERMTNMLKGLGTFDAKTGVAKVNGMNMDIARGIAQAMGISPDEAVTIAKKQAEMNYKEKAFAPARGRYSEDEWDFIMNKSQVENGKLMITDSSGQKHDVSNGLPKDLINEMRKFEGMDERALMESQAHSLTDINSKLEGIGASILAQFAQALQPLLNSIMPHMDGIGKALSNIAKPVAGWIGDMANKASSWLDKHGDKLPQIIEQKVTEIYGYIKNLYVKAKEAVEKLISMLDKLAWIGGILGGLGALGMGMNAYRRVRNMFGGRPSAAPSASPSGRPSAAPSASPSGSPSGTSTNGARSSTHGGPSSRGTAWKNFKNASGVNRFQNVRAGYQLHRESGFGRFKSFTKGVKMAGPLSKFAKVGGGIGVALSAAQGISAISDYSEKKDELQSMLDSGAISKQEYESEVKQARTVKNEGVGSAVGAGIGAALGTAIAGPIGTVVGGFLGDTVGGFIGKHWDTITEVASNAWNATVDFAKGAWDTVTNVASTVLGGIKDAVSAVWGGITSVANDVWGGVKTVVGDAWNGMKTVASDVWGGIRTVGSDVIGAVGRVANGAIETYSKAMSAIGSVAKDTISTAYNGAKTVAKDVYGGVRAVISDVTNGVSSLFRPRNDVKAKPIGEKEYIYVPKSSETYNVNGNTVTVKDFNIKIDGTIKLDAGNYIKSLDVKGLLEDHAFVSSLKTMIKDSINADINNGRVMNDVATLRGNTNPTTIWGRRR